MEEIENAYQEAAQGIKEEWLLESSTLWYDYIASLPDHLQAVYTVAVLERQVLNGGFDQYFVNGYGQFAALAIEHLKTISSPEKAQLTSKALEIVNPDQLSPGAFRKALMDQALQPLFSEDGLGTQLDNLDDAYWNSEEDIADLLTRYLKGIGYSNG